MAWLTTKDGRHFNTDWLDKDRQIAENKKEADERNRNHSYEEYRESIKKWVTDMDSITDKDRGVLEDLIYNSEPIKAQSLSRGITMTRKDLEELKVGNEWGSGKLSSWSTRVGMAQAHAREKVTPNKPCQVIFRFKGGTNQGAKLTGQWGVNKFTEGEVIMSSKAKFTILKIKKIDVNRTEVWVEEK